MPRLRTDDRSRHRPRRRGPRTHARSETTLAPGLLVEGTAAARANPIARPGSRASVPESADSRHPADVDPVGPDRHPHDVDAVGARLEPKAGRPDPGQLDMVKVDQRIVIRSPSNQRLDLDRDPLTIDVADQVDLPAARSHIAVDDAHTTRRQNRRSNPFSEGADGNAAASSRTQRTLDGGHTATVCRRCDSLR